jgi:hypothetical protein
MGTPFNCLFNYPSNRSSLRLKTLTGDKVLLDSNFDQGILRSKQDETDKTHPARQYHRFGALDKENFLAGGGGV